LKAPTGSESLADFVAMAPSVFAAAEETDRFFGHATAARPDLAGKNKFGEDFGPWGIAVAPRFYDRFSKPGEEAMLATLSLWRDIEVAREFGKRKRACARFPAVADIACQVRPGGRCSCDVRRALMVR
jgi:hypothetical protein